MMFDVYTSYEELNSNYATSLDADTSCEQLGLIVVARKWSDSGLSEEGPYFPISLGLDLFEHIRQGDKVDIFIYQRNY
jgi:hypothetical protein